MKCYAVAFSEEERELLINAMEAAIERKKLYAQVSQNYGEIQDNVHLVEQFTKISEFIKNLIPCDDSTLGIDINKSKQG